MKKLFYSLMTIAALLTAASCQKEFTNSPDPAYGGKPVVTTFNVDLGVATKAVAESALDDGTTVDKLYVAAFAQADGSLVSTSLVGANAASISNKTATVKLTLSKGQAYDIVFFAMKDGAYDVSFANGPTATFSYKSGAKANDPTLDAFYKKVTVASASTTTESVTLKRPFAQINVLSSNAPTAQTISSTMTVKQVPTTFDLFNEAAGATLSDLTFAENAISAAAFGKYANAYTWLAMNFVLPNPDGVVELSFQATQMDAAVTVKNVAVKKNGRTNLVGAIYDLDAELTYNVTVDPVFDEEGEGDLNDTVTTIATTTTYTEASPLVIDASNGPASVTLTVNGGDTFDEIETGAAGGTITAASDNEDVATVAVDKTNNAVTITPVGNGTAKITVNTPRYTKAGFTAGSIEIPVQVTGIVVPAVDPELSVTGFPTDPVTEPFTVTLTNKSDGELTITVAPENAASVVKAAEDGKYTVTPAEQENDTEVTVTFATAATAAYLAGEAVGTFTIAGSGGGDEPPTTSTIADIKTAFAQDGSLSFNGTIANVIVTYVNGKNAYIEDATGGLLIFADGHGFKTGETLAGSVTLAGTTYQGLKEITTFTKGEDFSVTEGATVPVTTVTVAELKANFAQYESRRVKLEGVTNATAIKANKTSTNITQGNDAYVIRTQAELSAEIPANSVFDVIGYPATFKTDTQLNVWLYDDFTVKSSGDVTTTISGMSNQSLKPGESYEFAATCDNPNGTIVYSIEEGSNVVTITGNKVTVKSDATVGATAKIKAYVAATAGYKEAEAFATITVKDPGSTTQEYTVEFTYDKNGGLSTTAGEQTGTIDDISVHLENGALNANGQDIRIYKSKKMTISTSSGAITKIVITTKSGDASANGPAKFGDGAPSGFAVSEDGTTGTWTGNSDSVDFTATDAQVRMISIAVTYEK